MKRIRTIKCYLLICTFISVMILTGCMKDGQTQDRNTNNSGDVTPESARTVISTLTHVPQATGVSVHESASVNIDYSNATEGYIIVNYTGSHTGKVKFRVTGPDGNKYTYNLVVGGGAEVLPLTGGSGTYVLNLFEQSSGNSYATVDSKEISVQVKDEFVTYLYPNQFVDFAETTTVAKKSREVAAISSTDMNYIENVYFEVMDLITYDDALAEQALSGEIAGYIPNLDTVMSTGQGICFDYAALMVAMLRAQDIPSKLVIGYAGEIYHAWITVYTKESGWIDGAIEFNGSEWSLLDPTFSDNSKDSGAINDYIGDGNNYTEKFVY